MHPTGFPAYTLLAWAFTHAVVAGDVAWRASLLSAVCGGVATAMLVRCALRLGASSAAALAAAALFATGASAWEHLTHAAVEPLVLALATFAIDACIAWDERRSAAALARIALFAGLLLATHTVTLWFIPGFALVVAAGGRGAWPARRAAAVAGLAFVAALALYAYLPLRSLAIDAAHADPTQVALGLSGQPFWNYDHPADPAGFVREVTGADFHAAASLGALREFGRYPAYAARLVDVVVANAGWLGAAFALAGIVRLARRPALVGGLIVVAAGVVPFSVAYGALVDAAKYYLVLTWIVALFVALGASAFARAGSLPALAVAVLVGIDLSAGMRFFDQRDDRRAQAVIDDVRAHTPPNAIVYGGWSYLTPLAYAAYVERSLGARVLVANVDHANIAGFTRTGRPVYYLPFPEDVDVPGARLERVAGSSPVLYRVVATASSSRAR